MLQNSFYEGVQRETEVVVKGHFKETHHLGLLDHVGSQNIRRPDLDTKRGPITPRESRSIQRLDSARSHHQSILHADFRSDPWGYLISSILLLACLRERGAPPGRFEEQPRLNCRRRHLSALNRKRQRSRPRYATKKNDPDP